MDDKKFLSDKSIQLVVQRFIILFFIVIIIYGVFSKEIEMSFFGTIALLGLAIYCYASLFVFRKCPKCGQKMKILDLNEKSGHGGTPSYKKQCVSCGFVKDTNLTSYG